MFTQCSIHATKNKLGCHRGKDCMERFCKDLKEYVLKIINFDEKEMMPLTYKENEYYLKFTTDKNDRNASKLYHKVRDHCHYIGKYRGAPHNICNLRYQIPKEIPKVFHNGSIYNYHFIIDELVKELNDQFE